MTLKEKLNLPAGPKLNKVLVVDLLGWKWIDECRGFDVGEKWDDGTAKYNSFADACSTVPGIGWDRFFSWLRRRDTIASIIPSGNHWTAVVGVGVPVQSGETPLLAAWRAALAWQHSHPEESPCSP